MAQELGKTVAEIERTMSAQEVVEWAEFFQMQSEAMNPKAGMSEGQVEFFETMIESSNG